MYVFVWLSGQRFDLPLSCLLGSLLCLLLFIHFTSFTPLLNLRPGNDVVQVGRNTHILARGKHLATIVVWTGVLLFYLLFYSFLHNPQPILHLDRAYRDLSFSACQRLLIAFYAFDLRERCRLVWYSCSFSFVRKLIRQFSLLFLYFPLSVQYHMHLLFSQSLAFWPRLIQSPSHIVCWPCTCLT